MKEYIIDDKMFVEHQTGQIDSYTADDLRQERDALQAMIIEIQEQVLYYDNIIAQISPVVKVSVFRRIVNRFRKT